MPYLWFKIFSLLEFNESGLVSRTYTRELEGLGLVDVMVTKGSRVSVFFDGVFLTIDLNATNPFTFEKRGVYIDANQDVWVGVEVEN